MSGFGNYRTNTFTLLHTYMVVVVQVVDAMEMIDQGFDPVAEFTEVNGDIHAHTSEIATDLGDDYTILSVVHGGIYLAKIVDHDDAYWRVSGEISEGKTGAWDSESDQLARQLGNGGTIVDDFEGYARYLVYEND